MPVRERRAEQRQEGESSFGGACERRCCPQRRLPVKGVRGARRPETRKVRRGRYWDPSRATPSPVWGPGRARGLPRRGGARGPARGPGPRAGPRPGGAWGSAVAAMTGGGAGAGAAAGGHHHREPGRRRDGSGATGAAAAAVSGGGGGMLGCGFSTIVSDAAGAGAALSLSELPEASQTMAPTRTTAPPIPAKSLLLFFLRPEPRLGSVASAGRRGGMDDLTAARAVAGAATGAARRAEAPGGATCAAGQGPADCRTAGLSDTGGGGGLTLAGATSPGSTMTLFASSSATTGLAGAWLVWAGAKAADRTSTCVPPPPSDRMSAGESEPAPVNGASSSSHDGRNAVDRRSRSSGVNAAPAPPAAEAPVPAENPPGSGAVPAANLSRGRGRGRQT